MEIIFFLSYFRSIEDIRKAQEVLEIILKTKSIQFSPGLTTDQQLKAMKSLISYLKKSDSNDSNLVELSVLMNKSLLVGFMYRINNNGSIQIPWNWYLSE